MANGMDMVILDVRDGLRRGEEPKARILAAVNKLAPGQSLRLLVTFEPVPLFRVLGGMGFDHQAKCVGVDDWEVVFSPNASRGERHAGEASGEAVVERATNTVTPADATLWPVPLKTLDNRGLLPPEPMTRLLEALESLLDGDVQEVFNDREPIFLYPELEVRGYEVITEKRMEGVRLLIRRRGAAS